MNQYKNWDKTTEVFAKIDSLKESILSQIGENMENLPNPQEIATRMKTIEEGKDHLIILKSKAANSNNEAMDFMKGMNKLQAEKNKLIEDVVISLSNPAKKNKM